MPRILLSGAGGQLGRAIIRAAPTSSVLKALSRAECDISDRQAVFSAVDEFRPDAIVNAAAYTGVDAAETDRDRAFAVNAHGPKHLAEAARAHDAIIVQISTDYVFDGSRRTPYPPEAEACPLGVYGSSKAEGERAVLNSGADALVLRTSWLYAAHGRNFLSTILRLLKTNGVVRVVDDQVGVPTAARDLADAIWKCLDVSEARGILHWTNAGVASWYDFATAIRDLAIGRGLIDAPRDIIPISTAEYPTAAGRPPYSVLDSNAAWTLLGYVADHWRVALEHTVDEIARTA